MLGVLTSKFVKMVKLHFYTLQFLYFVLLVTFRHAIQSIMDATETLTALSEELSKAVNQFKI